MANLTWEFVEDDADGAMWLAHPTELFAFVRANDPSTGKTYSIMVVTQSWLAKQVAALSSEAMYSFFAPMLALRDGSAAELRRQIDEALSAPMLATFGRPNDGRLRAT